jgi:hypothetical protein
MRLHRTVLTLIAAAVIALPLGTAAQQPPPGKPSADLEDHLKQVQQLQAQVKSAPRAAR